MANPFSLPAISIGGGETPTGTAQAAFYGTSAGDRIKKKWSNEIFRLGMDQLLYMNFLTMKNYFGMTEGNEVSVGVNFHDRGTKGLGSLSSGTFQGIPYGSSIEYGTRDQSNFLVKLAEYGYALDHRPYDDYSIVQQQMPLILQELGFNAAINMDRQAVEVFRNSYTVARTNGTKGPQLGFRVGGTLLEYSGTTGSSSAFGTGDRLLTGADVLDLETSMRECFIPRFVGDTYILVGGPGFFNGLRKDKNWVDLQLYNNMGRNIINHEIGQIHGVRCIMTAEHSQPNVGYIFGPGVGVVSWALAMDLRIETDLQQDYNRRMGAAWYWINGVAPALRDFYYDGKLSSITGTQLWGTAKDEYTGRPYRDLTGYCIKVFTGALPAAA